MKKVIVLSSFLFFLSCDGGLQPPPLVEPGIGGTIYFAKDSWPGPDSLFSVWLFASQIYPLDSSSIFSGILTPPFKIFLYPALTQSLPFGVDSVNYTFKLPPGTYKYIGVMHQFRLLVSIQSFQVVGYLQTSANPPEPRSLLVRDQEFIQGVNINADFRHLPPQPF